MAVFSSTQNTVACWGGLTIQANNISRLELELRVVGSHLAFDPMGLKPGALPHPRHHHVAEAQVPGQLAAAPVRGAIRRRSARPFQNPGSSAGVRFYTAHDGEYSRASRPASKRPFQLLI